ncbi:tetratricopeptide repeat protein [Geoalkalibacter sp.]|uniref:tetratricopeptide repeat protein n=1 Tax=Geoalkalibacter sp. TaxID=3041440 RepID=UPI00272E444B|nr:tetratricopeptide repeat protein [Geoalkalibacter sp.]
MTIPVVEDQPVKELARAVVDLGQDPSPSAWRGLVQALRRADCAAEAQQFGRIGIRRFPDSADLHLEQARLLVESQDFSGALESLNQVLHLAPENVEALWLAADAHHRLGRAGEARDALTRLLRLHPGHQAARDLLSQLEPATPTARGALEVGGKRTISTPTLAEIFVKQGYLSKAIQIYEDLLARDPGNERLRGRLRQLQEDIAAPRTVDLEPQGLPEPLAPPLVQVVTEKLEPATPDPTTAVVAPENRLLGTLENWLEAISRRRQHVH